MNFLQAVKTATFLAPGTVATNATASQRVDTLGYARARVTILLPAATATDSTNKLSALALNAGDSTTYAATNDISGYVGTTNSTATSGTFVIPNYTNTSTGGRYVLDLPMPPNGRYLFLRYQAAASHSNVAAICQLYNGDQSPDTATEAGVDLWVKPGN